MKYIKIFFLLVLSLPIVVLGLENGVYIECPENITKNSEFECKIFGYSDYEVSAIEYAYRFKDCEQLSFIVDPLWEGEEIKQNLLLYTDNNKIGKFNIGLIKLQAQEDIKKVEIISDKLAFGDKDFNENIIVQNNVNDLESSKTIDYKTTYKFIKYVIIMLLIVPILAYLVLKIKSRRENL